MRARIIKPKFFKDAKLVRCSVFARLLFPGLWMMADREGRMEYDPDDVKMELLPCDDVDIASLVGELESAGMVATYGESKRYLWIRNFAEHQKPHHQESPSKLPAHPEEVRKNFGESPKSSGDGAKLSGNLGTNRPVTVNRYTEYRNRKEPDGNGVHTHTGTGPNRTTEHISALLPSIGIPANPEPPPRTKLSAARILAATREPPEAERYWAEMASALKTIGRLDVLLDGLERLETTSDLDSPAKWLNRQCTRELDKGGAKRPKSWKVKT